jgi:sugar lactone lactonase YvrE
VPACHAVFPFDAPPSPDVGADDSGVDVNIDLNIDLESVVDGPDHLDLGTSHDLATVKDLTTADSPQPGTVTTLAGTGVAGYKDGPAYQAQFNQPAGIAVDSAGTLYVVEEGNYAVRMIAGGVVSTIAGQGTTPGYKDGPASTAEFNQLGGIAIDSAGKLYLAGFSNNRIRVLHNGQVTTLAGNGSSTSVDGPAPSASFNHPHDLVVDTTGAVYVAEMSGNRVRKIAKGQVTTFAGSGVLGDTDGPVASAEFTLPTGIDLDGSGGLVVAEQSRLIRRIANGQVSTLAGKQNEFSDPEDVVLGPGGVFYIADFGGHSIKKLENGQVTILAGDPSEPAFKDGTLSQARFYKPHGLAVGPKGELYVADYENHAIRVLWP